MQLITDRLILRSWCEDDRVLFADLNSDPDVMRYFPASQPRTVSDASMNKRMAHDRTHGFCFWAAEHRKTSEFIGFIGMEIAEGGVPFAGSVEIGWRINKTYWGQGLAPEGARACLAYAFSRLGVDHVISYTSANNTPSRRVMEKIGMVHLPEHDFDHPAVPDESPVKSHVLYRIHAPDMQFA